MTFLAIEIEPNDSGVTARVLFDQGVWIESTRPTQDQAEEWAWETVEKITGAKS